MCREDKKNVIFKEIKSMKQTIEIEVPDGKKVVWKDGKVVFEDIKPQLPKTWENFCKQNRIKDGECFLYSDSEIIKLIDFDREEYIDRNVLPNIQAAKAHLALMQLHQLRDCYRQGWEPNYSDDSQKVNIEKRGDTPMIVISIQRSSFLSFPIQELAEQFLTNFRDLIEQAGDLI